MRVVPKMHIFGMTWQLNLETAPIPKLAATEPLMFDSDVGDNNEIAMKVSMGLSKSKYRINILRFKSYLLTKLERIKIVWRESICRVVKKIVMHIRYEVQIIWILTIHFFVGWQLWVCWGWIEIMRELSCGCVGPIVFSKFENPFWTWVLEHFWVHGCGIWFWERKVIRVSGYDPKRKDCRRGLNQPSGSIGNGIRSTLCSSRFLITVTPWVTIVAVGLHLLLCPSLPRSYVWRCKLALAIICLRTSGEVGLMVSVGGVSSSLGNAKNYR